MNIVIFGPPGAGKGTQSNFIVKKFNLYQLSTGELLRKEINNKTQLGKQISSIINDGNLVSDEIVGNLIEKFNNGIVNVGELKIEDALRVKEKQIIPLLVKAVQELKKENDDLKDLIKNSSSFAALKSSL